MVNMALAIPIDGGRARALAAERSNGFAVRDTFGDQENVIDRIGFDGRAGRPGRVG